MRKPYQERNQQWHFLLADQQGFLDCHAPPLPALTHCILSLAPSPVCWCWASSSWTGAGGQGLPSTGSRPNSCSACSGPVLPPPGQCHHCFYLVHSKGPGAAGYKGFHQSRTLSSHPWGRLLHLALPCSRLGTARGFRASAP